MTFLSSMERRKKEKARRRAKDRVVDGRGKLHRRRHDWFAVEEARCGVRFALDLERRKAGDLPRCLSDDQFAWLPRDRQCATCLAAYWPARYVEGDPNSMRPRGVRSIGPIPVDQRSADQTKIDAVELFCVALAALVEWCARPHMPEHRCYHRLGMLTIYRDGKDVCETFLHKCRWHEHRGEKRSILDAREWWYPVGDLDVGSWPRPEVSLRQAAKSMNFGNPAGRGLFQRYDDKTIVGAFRSGYRISTAMRKLLEESKRIENERARRMIRYARDDAERTMQVISETSAEITMSATYARDLVRLRSPAHARRRIGRALSRAIADVAGAEQ